MISFKKWQKMLLFLLILILKGFQKLYTVIV